jgi:hypothetical protein
MMLGLVGNGRVGPCHQGARESLYGGVEGHKHFAGVRSCLILHPYAVVFHLFPRGLGELNGLLSLIYTLHKLLQALGLRACLDGLHPANHILRQLAQLFVFKPLSITGG